MGLNFTIDFDLGALNPALVSIRNDQSVSRHKECRQMMIELVHCGSSSILKAVFFGTPCSTEKLQVQTGEDNWHFISDN